MALPVVAKECDSSLGTCLAAICSRFRPITCWRTSLWRMKPLTKHPGEIAFRRKFFPTTSFHTHRWMSRAMPGGDGFVLAFGELLERKRGGGFGDRIGNHVRPRRAGQQVPHLGRFRRRLGRSPRGGLGGRFVGGGRSLFEPSLGIFRRQRLRARLSHQQTTQRHGERDENPPTMTTMTFVHFEAPFFPALQVPVRDRAWYCHKYANLGRAKPQLS